MIIMKIINHLVGELILIFRISQASRKGRADNEIEID